MGIKVTKLRKYNPSMKAPGNGEVEVPMNMDHTQRGGERNARHYANAMKFGGTAKPVRSQYDDDGAQGDGSDS